MTLRAADFPEIITLEKWANQELGEDLGNIRK